MTRDEEPRRSLLDGPEPVSDPADREFVEMILGAGRTEQPPDGLEPRLLGNLQSKRRALGLSSRRDSSSRRSTVLLLAAALLGSCFLLVGRSQRMPTREITPEQRVGSPPERARKACDAHRRASGEAPSIDDFEDQDNRIRDLEGRAGTWYLAKDSDPKGRSYPLVPETRPRATAANRYALHVSGDELRDWGASFEFAFSPSCYDASAYAGVAFSARGPGRVYLAVREMRVVGVEYGGACVEDCYNAHVRKLDLDAEWQRFEVRWENLHQRGYQMPAVDPTKLHSLTFQVHAEDTPYDLWIDDVEFIPR